MPSSCCRGQSVLQVRRKKRERECKLQHSYSPCDLFFFLVCSPPQQGPTKVVSLSPCGLLCPLLKSLQKGSILIQAVVQPANWGRTCRCFCCCLFIINHTNRQIELFFIFFLSWHCQTEEKKNFHCSLIFPFISSASMIEWWWSEMMINDVSTEGLCTTKNCQPRPVGSCLGPAFH